MFQKVQLTDYIIQQLHNSDDIFMHVLDDIQQTSRKDYHLFFNENDNSIIAYRNGHMYISDFSEITSDDIYRLITDKKIKISYLYGHKIQINNLYSLLNKKSKVYHNYFVMRQSATAIPKMIPISSIPGINSRICTPSDFNRLQKLQYHYHLEEVYNDSSYYPYKLEMKAFKDILQTRLNYAIFLNNKALSKVYINAQSQFGIQIGGVYTDVAYRGQGLGYVCIHDFLHYINSLNSPYKYCQLFVKQHNTPAIRLYQKLLFSIYSETTSVYYT